MTVFDAYYMILELKTSNYQRDRIENNMVSDKVVIKKKSDRTSSKTGRIVL